VNLLTDQDRLRDFWNTRYGQFTLSESGWMGAGEQLNELLYRCKVAALRAALVAAGRSAGARFSALDAGCGQGYFARFYRDEYPSATYVGVDISDRVIDHLRAALPGAEFYRADLSQWSDPAGRSFDVVQCVDVLQMILDDRLASDVLARLSSLVAPGGSLLITAPQPDATLDRNGYLRYRSRSFWHRQMAASGFRLVSARPIYYWLPSGGPANRYLRYAMKRLGPRALYLIDRVALAAGVPRPPSAGIECHSQLLVLQRITEPSGTASAESGAAAHS
jgi:SAM-dependent methyltransferase